MIITDASTSSRYKAKECGETFNHGLDWNDRVESARIEKLEAENKRLHGLVCQMCDGHGAVGNCLDSIDCPECSLYNAHDDAITENSERLQAENKRLETDVKKAFWWSAENTMVIHANKIQLAWEDFNTYFRGAKG